MTNFYTQEWLKLGYYFILTPSIQQSECANFEMRSLDCLEAYGSFKGKEKCKDLFSDLKECIFYVKQQERVKLMRQEHVLQYKTGKKKEMFSKTPHYDIY